MNQENRVPQKKQYRFGWVDALIILLVLAVAGAAVWIFGFSGLSSGGDRVLVEYVIEIKDVRSELVPHIASDVTVLESAKKVKIGDVYAVSDQPMKYENYSSESGELVVSEKEGYRDVLITVRAWAQKKSTGGYTVNNIDIAIGTRLYTRLPDFAAEGYITSLREAG